VRRNADGWEGDLREGCGQDGTRLHSLNSSHVSSVLALDKQRNATSAKARQENKTSQATASKQFSQMPTTRKWIDDDENQLANTVVLRELREKKLIYHHTIGCDMRIHQLSRAENIHSQ
jgi:hypothetical protein